MLSRAGGFRSWSPSLGPMITKQLLFEKHYSEQDEQDPCPCEVTNREEEGLGHCRYIYIMYPDFNQPGSTSTTYPHHHHPSVSSTSGTTSHLLLHHSLLCLSWFLDSHFAPCPRSILFPQPLRWPSHLALWGTARPHSPSKFHIHR